MTHVVLERGDTIQQFRLNRIKFLWIALLCMGITCGMAIGAVRGWGQAVVASSSASTGAGDGTTTLLATTTSTTAAEGPAAETTTPLSTPTASPLPTTTKAPAAASTPAVTASSRPSPTSTPAPSPTTAAPTTHTPTEAPTTTPPLPPGPLPILLMGDSVTDQGWNAANGGWGSLLQRENANTAEVMNFARSGDNTTNCIKYILPSVVNRIQTTQAISQAPAALIAVWYGVNDATLANSRYGDKHNPVDKYQENLIIIVSALRKAAPHATILLITPPFVDDAKRMRSGLDSGASLTNAMDRSNEQAGIYAAACQQVAEQLQVTDHKVELLHIYDFFMIKYPQPQDRSEYLGDGLHFSRPGHMIVFHEIQKFVDKLLPPSTSTAAV